MRLVGQLELPLYGSKAQSAPGSSYRQTLEHLLSGDLDFHGQPSSYSSHNLHAFPAKFPPQLPRAFIEGLTTPGDVVLDPMAGSGTTVVEAFLTGRRGIGLDIDPLALLLCQVKTTSMDVFRLRQICFGVLREAESAVRRRGPALAAEFVGRLDARTAEFLNYWFLPETQAELAALVGGAQRVQDRAVRAFLQLAISAVIITKSGGVSLARDLAHTRPHRVPDKTPRSALAEFEKRLRKNLQSLRDLEGGTGQVVAIHGNAQSLPLATCSVDLIVTSPPYASNAIDYMRAHKFSLVWLGYPLSALARTRNRYMGGEATDHFAFEPLPGEAANMVSLVSERDSSKARVLQRYYSEMSRSLREMFRVLKPRRAAIVVVGTSVMRGLDTRTHECLSDIGQSIGFDVVGVSARRLDRDRRMMPARPGPVRQSQIEHRMHEEYVIGFCKPEP